MLIFPMSALKRPDDTLSARKMLKYPMRPGNPLFGVDKIVIGTDGKPLKHPDGKLLKKRVHMANSVLPNGEQQSLYFPQGHKLEGVFKGMATILEERGFMDVRKLRYECLDFKCPKDVARCCCRRLLYNQPVCV